MTAVLDRAAMLRDGEYFASQLARCLEELQQRERGYQRSHWQQAGQLTRLVRAELRRVIDADRRRRRLEAMRP